MVSRGEQNYNGVKCRGTVTLNGGHDVAKNAMRQVQTKAFPFRDFSKWRKIYIKIKRVMISNKYINYDLKNIHLDQRPVGFALRLRPGAKYSFASISYRIEIVYSLTRLHFKRRFDFKLNTIPLPSYSLHVGALYVYNCI